MMDSMIPVVRGGGTFALRPSGLWRARLRARPLPGGAAWAAGLVAAASLLPLGFILWVTAEAGWSTVVALVFRGRVAELLLNTLLLELSAVPMAALVALALAWLTERSDLPGAPAWAWLAVAPLAIPAFVQSYAWVTLIPGLHGLPGAVLVSVLSYYPFVFLPLVAQLRRLDPMLEETAASLGHGRARVFFGTVLPQLRLAFCGGGLLVGLHLLGEYGLFAAIGFETFTTAIVDQFQSADDSPAANLLGGVLIVFCAGLLAAEALLRGGARYARVGSGAPRERIPARLGGWTIPALLLPAAVAALALGVPLLTLSRWLFIGGTAAWNADLLGGAFAQTMGLALGGALIATLAAAPMAWLSVRSPGRLSRLLEACHYYVGSLPGIIVALALVAVTVRLARPLYQTYLTILAAYALIFLPRALVGMRASLAQVPVELERAATALGHSPLRAVAAVTARLAAPGLAASMALVGLGITTELTATLLLAPNGTHTLATEFWSWSNELDYARAAPFAILMIVLSLPLTAILHRQSRRAEGR
jgi:iron(III) transport system permease protein